MSLRYVTEQEVGRLIEMPTAIATMRQLFQLDETSVVNLPRERLASKGITLHMMAANVPGMGYVGVKTYATTRAGAKFLVTLFDATTGSPVAAIEANRLGQLRTGAVTGVFLELLHALRPKPSYQITCIGTGFQAETQIAAAVLVLPNAEVVAYSRNSAALAETVTRWEIQFGVPVKGAATADDATRNADVVVTATTSSVPVISSSAIKRDAAICAVGSNYRHKSEIEAALVASAALVVCDDIHACQHEAGELIAAETAGMFAWTTAKSLRQLMSQTDAPDGIVLFKSVGLAAEDVALASVVLRKLGE
jgi:alanine dehydrogenase